MSNADFNWINLPHFLRLPWIISPHAPRVPFQILHRELAAAVVRVLQRAHDRRARGHARARAPHPQSATTMYALRVSTPPNFVRRLEAAPILIVLAGAEHDHAAAQCQFRMEQSFRRIGVHRVPLKSKDLHSQSIAAGAL